MTDSLTKKHRSWNMGRIKSHDTKPELVVRSLLHSMGFRFRLHKKDLPGRPDIVLPKYRTVIFVHGCFWHRHEGCKYAYTPKSRIEFWKEKFQGTITRDKKNIKDLKKHDWKVVVVWECEIRDIEKLKKKLKTKLSADQEQGY